MRASDHDVVVTEGLGKRYGTTDVVADVCLRVPAGSVYGFLGPNGSGKSTTMKMLLGLVTPTAGSVEVLGGPMTRSTRRALLGGIGSLVEAPPGYAHLTGAENLRIQQRLLGLADAQVARAAELVRLGDRLGQQVRHYSLGMKQRLGIALALARGPALLLLDEPTNGLDPAGIEEVRELLPRLAQEGTTVVVSSHLLHEVERTATHVGVLDKGRLVFQGSRADLDDASRPDVLLATTDPSRTHRLLPGSQLDQAGAGAGDDGRTQTGPRAVRLPGADDDATARAVATLVGAGVGVHGVHREERSLEALFTRLTSRGAL